MTACHLDFESASAADLGDVGVYRYVEHPSTRIWLFSYQFDGGNRVERWRPGLPTPERLLDHVVRGGTVKAHNANFERQVWNGVLRRLPEASSWPVLSIGQMDCTMARALAIHLPADLDDLAKVLGLIERKDKEGKALMRKMMRPRKRLPDGSYEWWNSPENIERLGQYCDQDVVVESEIDKKLPPLSAEERALWELDQRINDRGVRLDVPMIEKIVKVLEVAKQRDNARMAKLTANAVMKTTENAKLLSWFQGRGFQADSIAKDHHADLREMADVLGDEEALAVLELRASGAKTSTAKFPRMADYAGFGDRARGLFAYHRASTGRFGGSGPQPQNLPRVDDEKELPDVLSLLSLLESASI